MPLATNTDHLRYAKLQHTRFVITHLIYQENSSSGEFVESLARSERQALCAFLRTAHPYVPTLCAGWNAADLAAHLVVRDRRPDSWPGLRFTSAHSWTEKVRKSYLERYTYHQLIDTIAAGPPLWLPTRISPINTIVNSLEFFIHHEDLLRAQLEWQKRVLSENINQQLWAKLPWLAKLVLRLHQGEVILVNEDSPQQTITINAGKQAEVPAAITGKPGELILWCAGRDSSASVSITGPTPKVRTM